MALEKPLWMQPASGDAAISYSAQQDRAGLLGAVFSREGVLDFDAGQLKMTQRAAGANFSVDIAAGRCAIVGDDVSDQGTYLCTSTTVLNLATPAKPASGTRKHRVVARVRDKLHNGIWTGYDWTIEVLQDTGSGAPAQPNSAITLGFINMSSSMTSVLNANIEDARPRASIGTVDRQGTFATTNDFKMEDNARLPSWRVNPDGWVSLGGWCRWRPGGNFTVNGYQLYNISAAPLPDAIKPVGYRDMAAISSHGPHQLTVGTDGYLKFLFQQNTTLVNGNSWFSFDGCGYRL